MFSLWDRWDFLGTFGFQKKNGKWKIQNERLFLIETLIPLGLAPFVRLRTLPLNPLNIANFCVHLAILCDPKNGKIRPPKQRNNKINKIRFQYINSKYTKFHKLSPLWYFNSRLRMSTFHNHRAIGCLQPAGRGVWTRPAAQAARTLIFGKVVYSQNSNPTVLQWP